MSVEAASAEELYFDFDGTEDYESWCSGTLFSVENGLYRLVTGQEIAVGDLALPDEENFTIEARIRYSNTAPRHHIYTKNNGIFIHMLYDGVYVENGKERLYSDIVDVGKDWHNWKFRFLNDGNDFEIYFDGNLILEGETEHTGGTHPRNERFTIYKIGETGEEFGIFEMDWRKYTPETSTGNAVSFNLSTDKTQYVEGEDVIVSNNIVGAGMDNIYAVSPSGAWTLYARQVGSSGAWIEITSGQAAAHTKNTTFIVSSGLGVNSVIAYTKRNSGSIAYASGDTTLASFDADSSSDLAKTYVNADANGNAGTVKTITCNGEKYAYASGGSKLLEIPVCPRGAYDWEDKVYVQFRTHAITDATDDKHTYFYFKNTNRIPKNLNEALYKEADASLSLKPDGAGGSEINYLIDGKVVAVGKKENNYQATISGLKAGTYTLRAESGGSTSKSVTFKVVPGEKGGLSVTKTSVDSAEVSFEPGSGTANVRTVELFVDGKLVATKTASPFSTAVSFAAGTTHTVSAIAKAESGIILEKCFQAIYPDLSGSQTTTSYSNEVRYSVSGSSGNATVNVSNGTHKLSLKHTKDGFTYLTDEGEKTFSCGTGDFIVVTDAYAADVYHNGMLVLSFAMPMTTEVAKTATNNGLTIENFSVTVPEERVTYFERTNVRDEKTYTEVANIPYSYVADLVMDRDENVRFYIKDGYFRTDVKIENGNIYTIAKLRKSYMNDLGTPLDAAPVWRLLGKLPQINGDMLIRVETIGGISRIYANDQQIGVSRGIAIVGGTGVAFDVESGSSIKKFTISDASDVYYYEDEIDGKGNFSTNDYWKSEGGDFIIDEDGGKMTLDTTGADSGWAAIDVAASKADVSSDIQITNGAGGFWYIFGKQDVLGGFVGYNFATKKFELGETVKGKTKKIAEVSGTLPVGETATWTLKTKRDKEKDQELVELFINGNKVISGYSTCHNNANIGFASSGNKAYIEKIKYRGNSKPVLGMLAFTNLKQYLTRAFMTDEGTFFVGESSEGYLFTDDGAKTLTTVPFDTGGVTLFDSFVRLDNGDLLGIDHGIYHPVSIEGGRAYQQHTFISKDDGKSWDFLSIIRPEKPYSTGMENRAFKTSTGRIINAIGDEYGLDGWSGEDLGAETIFYSDDEGKTWKTTDIVRAQEIGMPIAESVALERSDGTIRMFFRTSAGSINYIDSHDNGTTFDFASIGSTPFETNVNCFNVTKDPTNSTTWWAVWGYDWGYQGASTSQWPRERFAVAVSYDEGSTWDYVGTVKEMNYDFVRYGETNGNAMNAGIFVDDKAVYIRFQGAEDSSDEADFLKYQFAIDKSKIVSTKSWEKLHLRDEFYHVEGTLDYLMKQERIDSTMLVGTNTDNLFMNEEFYEGAVYQGNIQAEYAAAFVGANVNINGGSVVFTKGNTETVLSGGSVTTANGKTFVSAEDFAKAYGYKLYEQDGYKIVSQFTGWRDAHTEIFSYTIGDYIEPPLYDAVEKRDEWREYLKELKEQEIVKADYHDGDYILGSFDADNELDLDQAYTYEGTDIVVTDFGDGKYAHAAKGSGNNCLCIPQILPKISSTETVYMKFRIHAVDNDNIRGKTVYIYTKDSNGKRVGRSFYNANASEAASVPGNRILAEADEGLDVLFEMRAGGHSTYVKTAGSDEMWTMIDENKSYATNSGAQELMVYYGLGVSDAVAYKKVDDATSAFNAAAKSKNVENMRMALSTYKSSYGIDLSKLDKVVNDSGVYAGLFNMNFEKAAEVAVAFDAAVEAQIAAELNIDYVVGDNIIAEFDATNAEHLANITVTEAGETVLTTTYGGETYAYAERVNGSANSRMHIPMIAPVVEGKTVYVKMRIHSHRDAVGGKNVYILRGQYANKRVPLNFADTLLGDWQFYETTKYGPPSTAPSVDVIFELLEGNQFKIYTREVGSDGPWASTYNGTGLKDYTAHSGIDMQFYYGLAVNNIKVYTKGEPIVTTLTKTAETAEKWSFDVVTKAQVSGTVYVGAYDENDALIGVATGDVNNGAKASIDMTVPTKGTVKYFKAFIWNQNFSPLAKPASLDK